MNHMIGSQMITPVYQTTEPGGRDHDLPAILKAAGDQWCNVIP